MQRHFKTGVNQETEQSSETPSRIFYGYTIVAVTFFIMVLIVGAANSYGVFLKPMITEFNWSRGTVSGALSLAVIVRGFASIAMGEFTDRFGPRTVLTLCGIIMGLGYLLLSQINAIWQLYLFYGIIIGTGLGSTFTPLLSTISRWFVERRSVMTGVVIAGAGVGTLIMAPVVSHLITMYGWRVSFSIVGSLILAFVILAAQFLRRDPTQVGQVAYGEVKEGNSLLTSSSDSFSLRQAIHTKQLWTVCAVFLCLGFVMMVILVHIVPHATDLDISTASAASILATVGGVSIAGRITLGAVADRIGNKQVFLIGFALISISLLWLTQATDTWMLYLFAVVFGFTYGGCTTTMSPLVAKLFGLSSHGLLLGITEFTWTVGGALGPFIAGYIFDVTGSYQVPFLICTSVGILGFILTWILTPT